LANVLYVNQTSAPAVSLASLLTVLFVGLKLTGFVSWPWYWVLAPLWVPLAALVSVAVVLGIFALICFAIFRALGGKW
jgi:hypothetical protein